MVNYSATRAKLTSNLIRANKILKFYKMKFLQITTVVLQQLIKFIDPESLHFMTR